MPSAPAASLWPLSTDWIPALTTSAIKAPVYIESANQSEIKDPLACMPPLKLNPFNSGYSKPIGLPIAK